MMDVDPTASFERSANKGHRPAVVWFTGLSGSGKSTIARKVEGVLIAEYHAHTYLLDGDVLREGINRDLGFSPPDRVENVRRTAEIARLMADAGLIVLASLISPYRADRASAREIAAPAAFIEVFVRCPVAICEQRDPKGLYLKARAGLIAEFTGVQAPYEPPSAPELILDTAELDLDCCVGAVVETLLHHQLIG
jgi:adenylyl-sulfate kinase